MNGCSIGGIKDSWNTRTPPAIRDEDRAARATALGVIGMVKLFSGRSFEKAFPVIFGIIKASLEDNEEVDLKKLKKIGDWPTDYDGGFNEAIDYIATHYNITGKK
jgi:hypothetical protein